jgi:hypothetical protein
MGIFMTTATPGRSERNALPDVQGTASTPYAIASEEAERLHGKLAETGDAW